MFNTEKNKIKTVATNINSPDRLNRIVEGTAIEGQINSESNIRIDGYVKGTIKTKGRLVLGPLGKIEGDIICHNADIEGSLSGTIDVKELLSLKSTAKLKGDITTNKLSIEPGALFSGTCVMGGVLKDIRANNDTNSITKKTENSNTTTLQEQSA